MKYFEGGRRLVSTVYAALNALTKVCRIPIPSSTRRGGRDINKMPRSLLSGADGVVGTARLLGISDHPVCRSKVAAQHFFDAAATPPRGGGD